ncbi:hypothetical protein [Trichothermofontia sp.]
MRQRYPHRWGGSGSTRGGDGDDILIGGLGADTLIGGVGRDIFAIGEGPDPNAKGSRNLTEVDVIVNVYWMS